MGTRYFNPLCFTFLIYFFTSFPLLSQEKIAGPEIVNEGDESKFSIDVAAQKIDWLLYPKEAGQIISLNSGDEVAIVWNYSRRISTETNKCTLVARVLYPNADQQVQFSKKIVIKKNEQNVKRKLENRRFSKVSRDSLRFFVDVRCDSANQRLVSLNDSSFSLSKGITQWTVADKNSKIIFKSSGNTAQMCLSEGAYLISLTRITDNEKTPSLKDSITIYPKLIPTFTLSNQSPCAGSIITFSNTTANQKQSIGGSFQFGNGESAEVVHPQKIAKYSYKGEGSMLVMMTRLEMTDLHGCNYESKDIAIQVQENLFTGLNVVLKPSVDTIRQGRDSVVIECTHGTNFSPANPNGPFTYQWNTGQLTQKIAVSQPGVYSVTVFDRFGCSSENVPHARIISMNEPVGKIKIFGPREVKAGQRMTFKCESCKNCMYQWKTFYNQSASHTFEPTTQNEFTPEGWKEAKPGTFKVVGIHVYKTPSGFKSVFSDTLRVRLVE